MSRFRSSSKSRWFFWLLVIADVFFWGAAFSWKPPALRSAPIVAVSIWPSTETWIVARESGHLSAKSINFVEMSWSSSTMRAFGNHAVDAAILSLSEVLLLRDLGQPMRVMMAVDESVGADALVAKNGIAGVSALKGKRIGVEIRSAGHYLLGRALAEAGLTLQDVQLVPLILPETETAFEDLGVEAVVTAEPWLTRLLNRGGHVLFDSSRLPGEIRRVLIVRDEVATELTEPLKGLVKAHFEGLANRDWSGPVREGILRREGLTAAEFEATFGRVRLHDIEDQGRLLKAGPEGLEVDFERVLAQMRALGMVTGENGGGIPLDDSLFHP